MARRTEAELSGMPLDLVYIAGNTLDAEKAEYLLTGHGIDYALRLEPFMKASGLGAVLGGTYAGVFFFVSSPQHAVCRGLLRANGFVDTIGPEMSLENTHGA